MIAAIFAEKEAIFREQAFPQALGEDPGESIHRMDLPGPGHAHELVTEMTVSKALLGQGIEKAPGIDLLNFRAI